MPEQRRGLRAALEALRDTTCDLTSLEVQTYTGNLDVVFDKGEEVNLGSFETVLKKVKVAGTLRLAAMTKVNFDGDTFLLTSENDLPPHVQRAHDAAVQAGMETRAALLSIFADVIGLGAA
jgi:hypothetical protein